MLCGLPSNSQFTASSSEHLRTSATNSYVFQVTLQVDSRRHLALRGDLLSGGPTPVSRQLREREGQIP